jgi:hypothetical protein
MQSKLLAILALTGIACGDSRGALDLANATSATQYRYGTPVVLGSGLARTYIVVDQKSGDPVEVGVALNEAALEGLPATGDQGGGGHEHYNSHVLGLPAENGTPYRFVELDWNPKGHGGPYTAPALRLPFLPRSTGRA